MHPILLLSLIFAVITANNSENKFFASRNSTRDSQNSNNKSHGSSDKTDLIKTEIKKYLTECGAEESDEESSETHSSTRQYGNNGEQRRNQNYGYGSWNSEDSDHYGQGYGSDSNGGFGNSNGGYGSSNSNGYGSSNSNGYGSSNSNGYGSSNSNSYGSSRSGLGNGGSRNDNAEHNSSGYGSSNGNSGYGHDSQGYGMGRTSDSYGNSGSMNSRRSDYGSGRDSFGYGSYVRPKRSDDDDDDNAQCISQCVFGYLEVLDDNRSPSESAIIKWLQDHMPNDGKRIKALRDTRRCFGQLSASDNGDGCEFSKSLSKCLNLDIEK